MDVGARERGEGAKEVEEGELSFVPPSVKLRSKSEPSQTPTDVLASPCDSLGDQR